MRSKEELIDEYMSLYRKAVAGKDPKKMKVLGEAENWVFAELAKAHPEMAENWIAHLETVDWDNWLSEKEAQNVTRKHPAPAGAKGAHWPYETFAKAVADIDENSKVTFTSKTDADQIVDVVKKMVEDLNTIIKEVKSAYSDMPLEKSDGSKYEPLTDEDMEGMSESAIETYEEKAKTGILCMDSDLSAFPHGAVIDQNIF